MSNLITAYRHDENGYYIGVELVQEGIIPPDDVLTPPKLKDGYWARWDGKKLTWTYEKIPTSASECVGMSAKHTDNSRHAIELRELFKKFCDADREHFKLVQDQDLTQRVEAIPKPTENKIALDKAEASANEMTAQINDLKEQMTLAQLMNDADLIAELQSKYTKLIEGA